MASALGYLHSLNIVYRCVLNLAVVMVTYVRKLTLCVSSIQRLEAGKHPS